MNIKKIAFYAVWLLALCLGPYVVLNATPLSLALTNRGLMVNVVQRILGLTGFTLLFFQVLLGSNMNFWTDKFGGWVLRFHIFEGVLAYIIILLHPISFLIFNYMIGHGIDPYFIFINVCLICPTSIDYYYTLGRIAFWLLTVSVFAGLFRMEPFLRNSWRKLHILNYLTFFIVATHGFLIGTDLRISGYRYFFFPSLLAVMAISAVKLRGYLMRSRQVLKSHT